MKSAHTVEGVMNRARRLEEAGNYGDRSLLDASKSLVDELNFIANVFGRMKWNSL